MITCKENGQTGFTCLIYHSLMVLVCLIYRSFSYLLVPVVSLTTIVRNPAPPAPPPASKCITANYNITWYWTTSLHHKAGIYEILNYRYYSNWFVYCTAHLSKMRLKPTGRSVGWSLSGVLPFPSAFILGVLFFLSFPD